MKNQLKGKLVSGADSYTVYKMTYIIHTIPVVFIMGGTVKSKTM